MTNIGILRVKPENVRPMNVVDMYITKGVGGILNYKYLKTYFKLASNERNNVVLTDVTFDVPVQDIQSGRLHKGCIILVEKIGNGLKYLGVDGDWETMLSFGIRPEDEAKFGTFSEPESVSLSYEEEEIQGSKRKKVSIRHDKELIAELDFLDGNLVKKRTTSSLGEKLANDWLKSRGFSVEYN